VPGVPPARYGYLGPAGTFTEAALRSVPAADRADLVPYGSVAAALEAVRAGEVDGSMVPLENSVEGSVATTLDELANGEPLQVTREVLLRVSFSLLGRPGTRREDVRVVATHPHAEAQCRRWLRDVLPARGAADAVHRRRGPGGRGGPLRRGRGSAHRRRALPPAGAGLRRPGQPGAVTRFLLVSRPGPPPRRPARTARRCSPSSRTTTPARCSRCSPSSRSRDQPHPDRVPPSGAGLGQYFFSIDCDGHLAEARVGEALAALHRSCASVRVLGSYPRADGVPTSVPVQTADGAYRAAAAWLSGCATATAEGPAVASLR
jgi:prephenate dehydratase